MGLFGGKKRDKKADKLSKKKVKEAQKKYKKSSQGERAYCTTCHKWYDPNNRRQFRKHSH